MIRTSKWPEKLFWFSESVGFFKANFFTIFGLGLVAAIGRAVQMKAFGPISPSSNVILEIVIESARVLIFLYALGLSNVRSGFTKLIRIFSSSDSRKKSWYTAFQKLKNQWLSLLTNMTVFLLSAWVINFLIDYAAYQTCLYATLKSNQIISDQASVWAFILFFKNISVIPFTLVFNALFLLWITNKLTIGKQES
ncbi:hypothetical protein GXP67_32515 [Rhodocytophaga rosea]|uniref:Uncharacterized protein n=1 Tax=Rhodocytophaga rosea TaxID=2704465 RepID=A0A6C0GSE7_9BACT|nr:hypothetical protein [Rhodocytophaga rosea]QHT71041.1 hypothetical protein GXP67_32515 [Rhodocytophaga rosea]